MAVKIPIPTIAALRPDAPTREKILTASSELLLTEGFSVLTQQAVALRAGVRQSHLTYYFPTRNDLLRATAQFGVETMMGPIAEVAARGPITLDEFRELLMPDKSDRQWFRLMIGLMIASEEDDGIRQWLREFDARVLEKLAAAFASVGIEISRDQLHSLHATFIGALNLDMQYQTDESFARVERAMAMALDNVLPRSSPEQGTPAFTEVKPHIKPRKSAP